MKSEQGERLGPLVAEEGCGLDSPLKKFRA